MTTASFDEDPRMAAAANRIAAARAETLAKPDTPRRRLELSMLDDFDRFLNGQITATDAEREQFLAAISKGWSN